MTDKDLQRVTKCLSYIGQRRLLELLGSHPRVRGHVDLENGRFAAGMRAFEVAYEQ